MAALEERQRAVAAVHRYNALSYATRELPVRLQADAVARRHIEWVQITDRMAAKHPGELCMMCLESLCKCQCTNSCPSCGKQCAMRDSACLWEPGMCECFIPGAQEDVADGE